MANRTIGSAGADHATLADFNTYLGTLGGFKENYTGLIHKVGPIAGVAFSSIDTSAYTLFLEPAQSAAFWHGTSASANPLRLHDDAGAAISGNPALGFTDMRWAVCGLQAFTSGGYRRILNDSRNSIGSGSITNCIFHNHDYASYAIQTQNGWSTLDVTNTLIHAGGPANNFSYVLRNLSDTRLTFTNCTFAVVTAGSESNTFFTDAVSANLTMRNCLFIGVKTPGSATPISFISKAGGHNASNLTSAQASAMGSATPFWGTVSGSAEFVTFSAVNYDFKILGNATIAVNNACATWVPTLDIMNRTRVAPHDLGAWDASAVFGAAGGATAVKRHYPYNALGNLQVTVGGLRNF